MIPVILKNEKGIATGNKAIKLYNSGMYGRPLKGGNIELHPIEVLHLFETKKIEVRTSTSKIESIETLIQLVQFTGFVNLYLVYKDLRFRGFAVGISEALPTFFRVYERGVSKNSRIAKYFVYPVFEGAPLSIQHMNELLNIAYENKKELVIALGDASGDVSYMGISDFNFDKNVP